MEIKQDLVDIYNLVNSIKVSGDDIDRVFYIKQKVLKILQPEGDQVGD